MPVIFSQGSYSPILICLKFWLGSKSLGTKQKKWIPIFQPFRVFFPPVVGGGGSACGKIWIELQKETNVSLAQTLYDP